MSSRIKRKQIDLSLTNGPTDGIYGTSNSPGLLNSDIMEDAFDKIVTILDQLAPGRPIHLGAAQWDHPFHQGFQAGTSAPLLGDITGVAGPAFVSSQAAAGGTNPPIPNLFLNGTGGYLQVAGQATGLDVKSPIGTTITTGGYNITLNNNADYWSGYAGRAGFWYGLAATFQDQVHLPSVSAYSFTGQYVSALGTAPDPQDVKVFTYHLESSGSGNQPTIANLVVSAYQFNSGKYISGVPVFQTSDNYVLQWDQTRVVRKFYLGNPVQAGGSNTSQVGTWSWPFTPAEDSNQTSLTHRMAPNNGIYAEKGSISLNVTDVLNVSASASVATQFTDKIRIDTISNTGNDAGRVLSNGVYDKTLNQAYDHGRLLNAGAYLTELMLEGGRYIYPTKNYSAFQPVQQLGVNADYTGGTGLRMGTWKVGSGSNLNTVIIGTPGNLPILSSGSFKVQVIIGKPGAWQTQWIDAGTAYNNNATDQAGITPGTNYDGAAGLILGAGSSTVRTVILRANGGTISGNQDIFVRVMWDKSQAGLQLTSAPTLLGTI